MTIENWILSVIPALLLLLLAWFAKRQCGGWLTPSAFLGLYWGVALLIPLILAPEFDFWPGAAWFIMFLGFVFHLGVLGGAARNRFTSKTHGESVTYELRWGKQILIISTLSGLIGGYILISEMGFSLSVVLSHPVMIAEIGRQYAGIRYGLSGSPPVIISILNIFLYSGGFFAGVWLETQTSGRSRAYALLPVIAGLPQVFLVNARTGFLWLIIMVISGYIATVVLRHRNVNFLDVKRVIWVILIIGLLNVLNFMIQLIREGENFQDAQISIAKTRVTLVGSPIVFSHWLQEEWFNVQPAWGARTFGGFFDLLGLAQRKQGLGWEGRTLIEYGYALTVGNVYDTNVYTAFRQLIEDFTLPGAIIVFASLGILMGKAYRKVLNGAISWLPILALFYGVTLGSYLANWLNYNSCLFGWLLFFFSLSNIGPRLLRLTPYVLNSASCGKVCQASSSSKTMTTLLR
jgi:oligosaccharide repeat unit polymerase